MIHPLPWCVILGSLAIIPPPYLTSLLPHPSHSARVLCACTSSSPRCLLLRRCRAVALCGAQYCSSVWCYAWLRCARYCDSICTQRDTEIVYRATDALLGVRY
eukprot:465425-Rhodomonas_salina.1